MKITVLGWYGHRNLGDEAMLEGIQHLFSEHKFTVLNDKTSIQSIIEKANQSDLFIIGGGELICRNRLFLPVPKWDQTITVPKIIFGCGVNSEPLEPHIQQSLDTYRFIGLRDNESCKTIPRAYPCLDPSLILAKKYAFKSAKQENMAAIIPTERNCRNYDEGIVSTSILEDSIALLRKDIEREQFKDVVLLAFGTEDNDDLETCNRLQRYLPEYNTVILKPQSPQDALDIVRHCRKTYAFRLHGLLFSWMLRVPFKCFGYHRKIKRAYDTLRSFTPETASRNLEENKEWICRTIFK